MKEIMKRCDSALFYFLFWLAVGLVFAALIESVQ